MPSRKTPAAAPVRKPAKPRKAAAPPQPEEPILPGVNPAAAEHLDPTHSLPFPILAIGASAGVRLPPLADGSGAGFPRKRAASRPKAAHPRRVLIVDDNPDSADSMRLMYKLAGHEVTAVNEGARALEAAASFGAEFVFLDIGLPDIDGYEVARRLRADPRTREAVIIAITGYGRDDDVHKSRAAGIDDHMVKPIDHDRLLEMVARGRGAAD